MSDERLLIQKAAAGDQNAFEILVTTHQKAVYNLALRMVGNPEDAADLSQEAFLKAWRSLRLFQFESAFSTWLYRLTSNTCIDFLRKRKKQNQVSTTYLNEADEAEEMLIPDKLPLPEEQVIAAERQTQVKDAMMRLDAEYRQILILRVIQGLSYIEIGELLDLKEGTVKSRLARAREKVRQFLESGNKTERVSSDIHRKEADVSCNVTKLWN